MHVSKMTKDLGVNLFSSLIVLSGMTRTAFFLFPTMVFRPRRDRGVPMLMKTERAGSHNGRTHNDKGCFVVQLTESHTESNSTRVSTATIPEMDPVLAGSHKA
jgi:hypothetical protein